MKHHYGFTMAEILLSLTIIGVVAAITLPSLTGNINERTWNTQRKALYARMSQAVSLMPALNGYGITTEATESASAVDTATETFLTSGLSKVLKINNICDSEHLIDCGLPTKITAINGSMLYTAGFPKTLIEFNDHFKDGSWSNAVDTGTFHYSTFDTKAAAFETQNGESIIAYYQPSCKTELELGMSNTSQRVMCVNFVYDLNGNKGPNTVGKDIGFISVLYPTDSVVVAPMPVLKPETGFFTHSEAVSRCKSVVEDGRIPNKDEASAMFYNKSLLGVHDLAYWSSSLVNDGSGIYAWRQSFDSGNRSKIPRNDSATSSLWCIKR